MTIRQKFNIYTIARDNNGPEFFNRKAGNWTDNVLSSTWSYLSLFAFANLPSVKNSYPEAFVETIHVYLEIGEVYKSPVIGIVVPLEEAKEFLKVQDMFHTHGDIALMQEIESCHRCIVQDKFIELLKTLIQDCGESNANS